MSVMAANTGVLAQASQPTSGTFWTSLLAAQTVGGWGSFTAQVITYRNGWSKSFGTIGYSGDANAMTMSAVWNYKWTCAATTGQTSAATSIRPTPRPPTSRLPLEMTHLSTPPSNSSSLSPSGPTVTQELLQMLRLLVSGQTCKT